MDLHNQESLEIDKEPNDDDDDGDETNNVIVLPSQLIVLRYIGLSSLALFLTITCPQTNARLHSVLLLIITYILLLINFYILHGSDPGYLTTDVLEQLDPEIDSESEKFLSIKTRQLDDPLVHENDDVDDHNPEEDNFYRSTRRKHCEVCNLSPPLRSHHCKICKKCVATFDHHCLFVGTCIGERNHCRFWTFLTLQCIGFHLCVNIIGSSKLGITSFISQGFQVSIARVAVAKLYVYPLFARSNHVGHPHTFRDIQFNHL